MSKIFSRNISQHFLFFWVSVCCLWIYPPVYAQEALEEKAIEEMTPAEKQGRRKAIETMAAETLKELYLQYPQAQSEIEAAAGYAVFQATQFNAVFYVGGNGHGIVYDNKTGKPFFMQLVRSGTGPGVGYKTFRQILIFKNRTLLNQFRSVGADFEASADATFKIKGRGISVGDATSLNPELTLYQLTDEGMLIQANWGSVTYLPDEALNQAH